MSLAIRAMFDPIRSADWSHITGTYYGLGTAIDHPARNIWLFNYTDKTLFFSFNGYDDNVILPPQGYWFWDITSNKTVMQGFFLAEGARLYVRSFAANPTSGGAYATVIWGADL